MDKSELRRTQLIALVKALGHGGISLVASKIGKEPSYVSRMLYEPNKAGKKRVTESSADLLDKAFPDWITNPDQAAKNVNNSSAFGLATESQSKPHATATGTLTLADLITQLGEQLKKADTKTRDTVADLLLRYAQDPADGARIAQAIVILMDGAADDSKI